MQNEGIDVIFIDITGQSTFDSISEEAMIVIGGSLNSNDSKENFRKWVSSRTSVTLIVFVKCDTWFEATNGNLEEINNLQSLSSVVKYILTSTYRLFDIKKYKQHEIGNLHVSDGASHELLRKLTPNLKQEERVKIANLTGNHPLALEIVGTLMIFPESPIPQGLIEDLKSKQIVTLHDPQLSPEERIRVCFEVVMHFTFPNLKILAQNLSHFPASFDEQSALEIVFGLSPEEASQSSKRKEYYVSQLRALHQLSILKYHRKTKRYTFVHNIVRECFLYEDRFSENMLFLSRFQLHYSQRLFDVSHLSEGNKAKALNDDMHNFQYMFTIFSTSNCTSYCNTTLIAMQKTFEAIMHYPLRLIFHADIYNLTKCMMSFFDQFVNTSCSDTVNTGYYMTYVKIVIAVSKQEEDACEVLLLRVESFEKAKDLLAYDESYHDFTHRIHKCLLGLDPNHGTINPTQVGSPFHFFVVT